MDAGIVRMWLNEYLYVQKKIWDPATKPLLVSPHLVLEWIVSGTVSCVRRWFSWSFISFWPLNTNINFLFLLILKMHTETLLRIPFSLIGWCFLVPTSHLLQGKCARINLSQAASGMILQNHRRLPVSIFQCQNRCFRAFEAGYRKYFKKEQAKSLSLIFLSTKKQKNCKTIRACTESNYLLL